MPGRGEPFAYALLRVVPSAARGEAMNAGVVVFCRRRSFLGMRFLVDRERLAALDPRLDLDGVEHHLAGMARVAAGEPDAGAVAALEQSERFGWLAAPSSTIIQPSPVHTGLCDDPEAVLARLYAELVELSASS
jgi:hypothetical protein